MRVPLTLCLAICSGVAFATGSNDTFETNFAKAQANARTERGEAYDKALRAAYEDMPDFKHRVTRCLESNPGHHTVRGYFLFLSEKGFLVALDPRDSFSDCLSQALASPSVPAPPSVPYLNPFTFTTQR